MPRLMLITTNYAPEPTGIPHYNTGLCRWFLERGWKVQVATGVPHYPWWQVPEPYATRLARGEELDEVMEGIEVDRVRHHVPRGAVGGRDRLLLDLTWFLAWLRRLPRVRRRPDLVLCIAPPLAAGPLGLVARCLWRVPVVIHHQDLQVDAARELGMLPVRFCRFLTLVEHLVLRLADGVSACSAAMARRLAGRSVTRRPVRVVRNWSDPDCHPVPHHENCYRREWGCGPDDVVVMYSGNLGRKQGVEVLLKAFAGRNWPAGVHLVVAGDGVERALVEHLVAALDTVQVHLLPLQPRERLGEFLSAGDIHVIPQLRAAADLVLPSKLGNIMAVARPVVATADAGTELHRVLAAAGCGMMVPPENPMDLAAAIATLTSDEFRRRRLGVAGRQWATLHLDKGRILASWEDDMKSMILAARRRDHIPEATP